MKDQLEKLLKEKKINVTNDKEVNLLKRIELSIREIKIKTGESQVYLQDIEMLENDVSWTLVFQIKESHFIN